MFDEKLKIMIRTFELEGIEDILRKDPNKVNEKDRSGDTPLLYLCNHLANHDHRTWVAHLSSNFSEYELIKIFTKFGANINEKSGLIFDSPLILVCQLINRCMYYNINESIKEIIKIVELLLDNGADVNFQNKIGETALHRLFEYVDWQTNYYEELIELVKNLIKNGMNINIKNNMGKVAIEESFFLFLEEPGFHPNRSRGVIEKIIILMIENGLDIQSISANLNPLGVVFCYNLEKENDELKEKVKRLEGEMEKLRYQPGNCGYLEAMKDFDNLRKKN